MQRIGPVLSGTVVLIYGFILLPLVVILADRIVAALVRNVAASAAFPDRAADRQSARRRRQRDLFNTPGHARRAWARPLPVSRP